jgi:hypothetical protein
MRTAVAIALLAAAVAAAAGLSRPVAAAKRPCMRVSGNVALYCGPATARLSAFPEVLFRSGSCARRRSGGVRLLEVRIGARSLGPSPANADLLLFSLQLTGPLSHPTSGVVLAYLDSKLWQGRTVWYVGDGKSGRFRASGVFPSRGQATGSFNC